MTSGGPNRLIRTAFIGSAGHAHFRLATETDRHPVVCIDDAYRQRQIDEVETLGESDGLYGTTTATSPYPSLIQGSDGRLWFASDAGLAWLNPKRSDTSPRIPPVHIRTLTADGRSYSIHASPLLAARNRNVEIVYSAIALSTPERIRFRYKLDGIGSDWLESGARRTANFNNLPPGAYTFRVESTNEAGSWTNRQVSLDFRVDAAWYQTVAFRLACGASALLFLWMLFRLRERQVAGRIMVREEARQVERNRIARDLHDTFLQSVQALIFQFQALSDRVSRNDPVRGQLDHALDLAQTVVIEGRDRVVGLRRPPMHEGDLAERLREWSAEIGIEHSQAITLGVQGEVRVLRAEVEAEIFQVLQEALINASRHAQASCIELELVYRPGRFMARVRDNGIGIADDVLEQGKADHWGMRGMRERAEELGATLSIRSEAHVGTTVELSMKGRLAFADQNPSSRLAR